MGGGMEGPPVWGRAGPRFPLLPAATPPRRGRGLSPVLRWSKGLEGARTMYGLSPGARPCVPCAGGHAARPAGGSRPGPGAWVAAGGRGGGGALRVRGPWRSRGSVGGPAGGQRWPLEPHSMGSAGALGALAPRRSGSGGRVCKGVGAPDAGPTAGRVTSGKLEAWHGGQGRGRARG